LLGYTNYTSYLSLGKQSLAEHRKLLAATISREESVTQIVSRSVLWLASSTGVIQTWQKVEYSFGYELESESYDVVATDGGIEIRMGRPRLIAKPAVTDLKYEILQGGLITDEKAAVLRLYEAASKRAADQGEALASDAAVVALCEKQLILFLSDFLAKQPGVRTIPAIKVVHRTDRT